jgi:hypothetical protein
MVSKYRQRSGRRIDHELQRGIVVGLKVRGLESQPPSDGSAISLAFEQDRANEAVAHAAANSGPFKMTVLRPS